MRRHHLSGVVAVVLLAAPASAAAQSAGDNQYIDPFAPAEKPAQKAKAPAQPAPAAAQAQAQPATASAEVEAQDPAGTGVADGEQLPRTGPHVEAMAALGLVLTASGAALLVLPGTSRPRPR